MDFYGYYDCSDQLTDTRQGLLHSVSFRVLRKQVSRLTTELESIELLLSTLLTPKNIAGVTNYLQTSLYSSKDSTAPNEQRLFEMYGALVGCAGWKQIGTQENIREVLKHVTVQLTFGKEKQNLTIASVLDNKK